MSRGILWFFAIFLVVIIALPAALVALMSSTATELVSADDRDSHINNPGVMIPVYLAKEKRVINLPLESYVEGVVAAEMPATFHMEALKAQALCARTYIVDRMLKKSYKDMNRWGSYAKGAVVTDGIDHQVYLTEDDLHKKWGRGYPEKINRIKKAVRETKGKTITYKGRPIYAAFFSTSNGRTENSEDYFKEKYPYLRSVTSPWDKQSPEYEKERVLRIPEMIRKLEHKTGKTIAMTTTQGQPLIKVLKRTQGNRIARIQIGDKILSGREMRAALNLPSSDFSIQTTRKTITFSSRGYGHGVGMSQWGANLMGKSGKTAQEIIHHYYQGVQID